MRNMTQIFQLNKKFRTSDFLKNKSTISTRHSDNHVIHMFILSM